MRMVNYFEHEFVVDKCVYVVNVYHNYNYAIF